MRILQITDLHIGLANQHPFDVDVRANFKQIIQQIRTQNADALMISGDLCYQDGDSAIYEWIKEELKSVDYPYYLLTGNHDDTKLMLDTFQLLPGSDGQHLYYQIEDSPMPCFCFDTGIGTISTSQLEWLSEALRLLQQPILIFMHHPPLPMGVPYMDNNHALSNGQDLCDLLTSYGHPVHIFTGHYHVDKTCSYQNLTVHITPSCFFQIDWRLPDFGVAHHRIAYRDIQVSANGLTHGLMWC